MKTCLIVSVIAVVAWQAFVHFYSDPRAHQKYAPKSGNPVVQIVSP